MRPPPRLLPARHHRQQRERVEYVAIQEGGVVLAERHDEPVRSKGGRPVSSLVFLALPQLRSRAATAAGESQRTWA